MGRRHSRLRFATAAVANLETLCGTAGKGQVGLAFDGRLAVPALPEAVSLSRSPSGYWTLSSEIVRAPVVFATLGVRSKWS
jgi:hypothetical protein